MAKVFVAAVTKWREQLRLLPNEREEGGCDETTIGKMLQGLGKSLRQVTYTKFSASIISSVSLTKQDDVLLTDAVFCKAAPE